MRSTSYKGAKGRQKVNARKWACWFSIVLMMRILYNCCGGGELDQEIRQTKPDNCTNVTWSTKTSVHEWQISYNRLDRDVEPWSGRNNTRPMEEELNGCEETIWSHRPHKCMKCQYRPNSRREVRTYGKEGALLDNMQDELGRNVDIKAYCTVDPLFARELASSGGNI